ncbi:E3 SUMO-protein ligase ZBED1-like [Drosophila santomea]|uniref:E3 SUMO-protein ligase ZBED1-like n=1 Tax=Drosophila santomea TaxID=129105 RepID=UPI001CCF2D31|nr:E3 SUMO-protein ligase ZBED1-like [Drosophila santomea]
MILRTYFERPNEPADKDPLVYWMANGETLKPITRLCMKYLCIPATSTESERTFSKAGQIISDRRSSLKPKYLDMLLFLNKNLNN